LSKLILLPLGKIKSEGYTKFMTIKFNDIVSKSDWLKISILLVIAVICWLWVWHEYQKPIMPPEWQQELTNQDSNRI